jgi:hypothetical protein
VSTAPFAEVSIDRVVLHGVEVRSRRSFEDALRDAIEEELRTASPRRDGSAAYERMPRVDLGPCEDDAALAREVARAVVRLALGTVDAANDGSRR